mgnify:CR=1 FL=1
MNRDLDGDIFTNKSVAHKSSQNKLNCFFAYLRLHCAQNDSGVIFYRLAMDLSHITFKQLKIINIAFRFKKLGKI